MCGIVGFLGGLSNPVEGLNKMVDAISHRGPDGHGIWLDQSVGIGLGHARLSVLDLSPSGHQPMHSLSGRYLMVFNGEIYNHLSLRSELSDLGRISWRGNSDTETLLAGFEYWGIEKTISKSIGMFAIALWDKELEEISIIRDRFGEKPLYYGFQSNTFMFASELKALKVNPQFVGKINRQSLNHYFRLNYIPTPLTIYEDIFKLEPGMIKTFSKDGNLVFKESFWSLEDIPNSNERSHLSAEQAINELEILIKQSIQEQKLSDVPLGAFLSGGIDSSTVVAILQSMSDLPVKTFTIGFTEVEFDEAREARAVSKYLGTEHSELIITAEDAIAVINELSRIYDEPFADASQIPTYLVSKLAKEKVTVCLSGDGGDELFCGYNRYHYTVKVWRRIERFSFNFRKTLSSILLSLSPSSWDRLSQIMRLDGKFPNLGYKIHKGAIALKARDIEELYTRVVSNWDIDENLVKGTLYERLPMLSKKTQLKHLNDLEKMMLWDKQSYLIDDVLVKTDRAAMACSLEGRVPFLDYRIAEFAASLPIEFKYRGGRGKWILREVLYRHVPEQLIERPKKGFSLPIADWLRGPLKVWAHSLLNSTRIDSEGFLESSLIEKKWHEHLSGKRDWSSQLWSVLMFQLWLEKHK